jgi:hypothetical protein
LFVVVLSGCRGAEAEVPSFRNDGDFANWNAWSIVWQQSQTFGDVTVKIFEKQQTYVPEQSGFVFLALSAELLNISSETQEMRFWQGPIYLSDPTTETIYDLVGIANRDVILMAPPYLLEDKTYFRTGKWDDGRFITVAYQHEPQSWFIQATPNSVFHVDFLFAVPADFDELVMHFGNGFVVNIH